MAPTASKHAGANSRRLGFIHAGVQCGGAAAATNSCVPLDTPHNALESVGGKGRSLSNMVRAGFRVPGGFLVTTDGYKGFVAEHGLQQRIVGAAVKPAVVAGRASFEACSQEIFAMFAAHDLSAATASDIAAAYAALPGEPAVAVRSSATAEDLPGLSFAGQQETFLNVTGVEAVVAAVHNCWASLWNPQAIAYRHQHGLDQNSVAMAVVVQIMIPSEVAGILFTANPATGDRNQMVINASFGLGEAVVGGTVTPDTFMVEKATRTVSETVLGPKAQKIISDGANGVIEVDVSDAERQVSSLSPTMLDELIEAALKIEGLYGGLHQDIEWAYHEGVLHLLQSRPITLLPADPAHPDIDLTWTPREPAVYLTRRQIVENMPEPLCPLFEELYLTHGLGAESAYMVGKVNGAWVEGGPNYMTLNGYAYQRFDHKMIHALMMELEEKGEEGAAPTEEDIEAAERAAMEAEQVAMDGLDQRQKDRAADLARQEAQDMALMVADLSLEEQAAFRRFEAAHTTDPLADPPWAELPWAERSLAHRVTMPNSDNSTYMYATKTEFNTGQLAEWHEITRPDLAAMKEKWAQVNAAAATDEELVAAIREMSMAEGNYWTSNASHTFGVAKSTDDHLQCFLREALPEHNFISGQFLSGILSPTGEPSKSMQANADLFEIAKQIRTSEALRYLVVVTPPKRIMDVMRAAPEAAAVLGAIEGFLVAYGHQGYSMDFVEPTQMEEPSGLFATLKNMVSDANYDPNDASKRATAIRGEKLKQVTAALLAEDDGEMLYWQFQHRLWLARRFNYIREEVAFMFGYCWSVLRPIAFELNRRMVEAGTFQGADDVFYCVTEELGRAIEARKSGAGVPELGALAARRRALRETQKQHHPPGTVPEEARQNENLRFKETQVANDDDSNQMFGFAVSSGLVTGKASVIQNPAEFDKMEPGTILVAPLTTPAWTQLFAHATGLVTDMGSILAHGSIVCREYGIPGVLGVGNGTQRIRHGQMITIDGDAGVVMIHDDETGEFEESGAMDLGPVSPHVRA
jgi:phosphohistidine swiveling domain-containing protein